MFIKKSLLSLVVVFTIFNVYSVSAFAARFEEVEKGYVEFDAFAPDDFAEPIEIQLTHKGQGYVLYYYLYKINNYFLNEAVPCGDYYVSVNIGERQDELAFIYENSLLVESANLAVPFSIIIDYASFGGDPPVLVNPEPSNIDEGTVIVPEEKIDDVDKHESNTEPDKSTSQDSNEENNEENTTKSSYSVLISFVISVVLLLVVAFILWKIKNR